MRVFADTAFWIAIINPTDHLHTRAEDVTKAHDITQFVTTDEVLIELLAFCSRGASMRAAGAATVRRLLADRTVRVIPQTHRHFLAALALYEQRRDKEYSLTDCTSVNAMRRERLRHVLTSDHHFEQEGFTILL